MDGEPSDLGNPLWDESRTSFVEKQSQGLGKRTAFIVNLTRFSGGSTQIGTAEQNANCFRNHLSCDEFAYAAMVPVAE
jgi:hypothetical protein